MVYRAAIRAAYDVALRIPGHPGPAGRVHGHRYTVEAVLESARTDADGFVVDFDSVRPHLVELAGGLDHRMLNELEPFQDGAPSAERQAEYFYRTLKEILSEEHPDVALRRVRVYQEPDAWAEYSP